jgi:pimeloyl-ACP methyl ester carboxylesterase
VANIGDVNSSLSSDEGIHRFVESGTSEQAEFFGSGGQRVFGCLHLPSHRPLGAVLICSPLHMEFEKNYRREVLLSRALAAHGVAVQRFHYRGAGNSDGETGSATLASMRDDAVAAGTRLLDRSGISDLVLLGTRWGGLVAAASAGRFDAAPLVLWEPVTDPPRYFRELFRARLMRDLKDRASREPSGEALRDELRRTGVIDIMGHSIRRELLDESSDARLDTVLPKDPRSVLLIEISRGVELRKEYAALAGRLSRRGFDVQTRKIEEEGMWWFVGGRPDVEETRTADVIPWTRDWILRSLSHGEAPS